MWRISARPSNEGQLKGNMGEKVNKNNEREKQV